MPSKMQVQQFTTSIEYAECCCMCFEVHEERGVSERASGTRSNAIVQAGLGS